MRYLQTLIVVCCTSLSLAAFAEDSLTIFKAGDTVKAAEINANFELIRAAAADAVSFEGLEDVYQGIVSETEEVSSTQAQSSVPTPLMSGLEPDREALMNNSVNAITDAIVPCSAEDESCVITGNKASVQCDGTTGKLSEVLASPLANAAFLKIEVEGDCVESMLVTRGAAFFSKAGTRASITARGDQFAVAVADYVHFENIDLNGRLTVGRGAMVILEKDVKLVSDPTRNTNTGDTAIYAAEGGFVKIGQNVDIEGSVIVQEAQINTYGNEINVSRQIIVNGGSFGATSAFIPGTGTLPAGLTTPSFVAVQGAVVNLRNGNFNLGTLQVSGSSVSINSATASPVTSLETGGIWVNNGGNLALSLASFVMNDQYNGFLSGGISIWDNSTASVGIARDTSFPTLSVVGGSNLRLAQAFQSGRYLLTVQDLTVGWGSIINSNAAGNGGISNILVENSIKAGYNSFIQYAVVDTSSPPPTLSIADGCASKGIHSDLCDLISE
jgi:hypothetical protein